jgi:hypothetical protein
MTEAKLEIEAVRTQATTRASLWHFTNEICCVAGDCGTLPTAPEGAFDLEDFPVSLKQYADTKPFEKPFVLAGFIFALISLRDSLNTFSDPSPPKLDPGAGKARLRRHE